MEEDLFNELRKYIPEGSTIEIVTPQFDREELLDFEWKPANRTEFNSFILDAPHDILIGFGFRVWDDEPVVLYLYPAEWFDVIPEGTLVTNIFNEKEIFSKETSSTDRRFGCLAYGFTRSKNAVHSI